MSDKSDKFEDIIYKENGIFDNSLGRQRHDALQNEGVQRDGAHLLFECSDCGQSTGFVIEYPEVLSLWMGVNPAYAFRHMPNIVQQPSSWVFMVGEQAWRPEVQCPNCHSEFPLRVSKRDCENYLGAAERSGFINQLGKKRVADIIMKAKTQTAQPHRQF